MDCDDVVVDGNHNPIVQATHPNLFCDFARTDGSLAITRQSRASQRVHLAERLCFQRQQVITKGVFSLEESLESLKSPSLESLENGRILLSSTLWETLEALNSLESLENGLF